MLLNVTVGKNSFSINKKEMENALSSLTNLMRKSKK